MAKYPTPYALTLVQELGLNALVIDTPGGDNDTYYKRYAHRFPPGEYLLQLTYNGPERIYLDVNIGKGWKRVTEVPAGDEYTTRVSDPVVFAVPHLAEAGVMRVMTTRSPTEDSVAAGYVATLRVIPTPNFQP